MCWRTGAHNALPGFDGTDILIVLVTRVGGIDLLDFCELGVRTLLGLFGAWSVRFACGSPCLAAGWFEQHLHATASHAAPEWSAQLELLRTFVVNQRATGGNGHGAELKASVLWLVALFRTGRWFCLARWQRNCESEISHSSRLLADGKLALPSSTFLRQQ